MSSGPASRLLGAAAATWGAAGVSALLLFAMYRLSGMALAAFDYRWSLLHWTVFVVSSVFMAYSEGYRGFQLSFAPRTAARVRYLYSNPRFARALLAPFYCAGFFGIEPKKMRMIWIGSAAIVWAVLLVQLIPQPWRGIIDAGVVVGLSWGVLSLWALLVRAFSTNPDPRLAAIPGAGEAPTGIS